jgi:glucosyl-3-phosphoglycerate synthase
MPHLAPILRQFQVNEGKYEQVVYELPEEERPPMIDIPEYRERFGIQDH